MDAERTKFSTTSYEVLITQHQSFVMQTSSNQARLNLTFNHPIRVKNCGEQGALRLRSRAGHGRRAPKPRRGGRHTYAVEWNPLVGTVVVVCTDEEGGRCGTNVTTFTSERRRISRCGRREHARRTKTANHWVQSLSVIRREEENTLVQAVGGGRARAPNQQPSLTTGSSARSLSNSTEGAMYSLPPLTQSGFARGSGRETLPCDEKSPGIRKRHGLVRFGRARTAYRALLVRSPEV